jgi:hypothetical protein
MAETIDIEESGYATVEEFCEYVRAHVRPDSHDSIMAASHALKALSNNRELLSNTVTSWLNNYNDDLPVSMQDTSFVLAMWGRFAVRANFWLPAPALPASVKMIADHYGYLKPHDHPFDFLTVGYKGAGYTTVIYENECATGHAAAQEAAQLRFAEKTTLPEGKIMFYRAHRDVHAQLVPDTLSVSLNLVVLPEKDMEQHIFDVERNVVKNVIGALGNVQGLCQFARALGSIEAVPGLARLASCHPAPEIRRTALHSLCQLAGREAEKACEKSLRDPSGPVRESARQILQAMRG